MQLRTDRFRCALCGMFRDLGVTETQPEAPEDGPGRPTQTNVCANCIGKAAQMIGIRDDGGAGEGPVK